MARQQHKTPEGGVSRRAFLRRAVDASPHDRPVSGVTLAENCLAHAGVACRLCDDTCRSNAIRFRPQIGGHYRPEINAAACTGCLQCVDICPVGALRSAEEPRHA